MLFLLKRDWRSALAALAVLAALGIGLRMWLNSGSDIGLSWAHAGLGLAVFAGTMVSDGLLHRFLAILFGDVYLQRFREMAGVFENQSYLAIVAGAAMAGIGEELVFRGLSDSAIYLAAAAVLFGLMHHIRIRLWPFTLWSIYEGVLFAGAMYLTSSLCVTMIGHFLHDLAGFFVFRNYNQRFLPHRD